MLSVSTAQTDLPKAHPRSEPFGQEGVRQHIGVVVNAVCITCILLACVMWYRSTTYYDRLEWRGGAQELRITSVQGRIRIDGASFGERVNNNGGWIFRSGLTRRTRDGWADSGWKIVGIEISLTPDGRAPSGFWIRIKWYFIVFACSIIPLVSLVIQWRRNREEAA
jgi:hypothetical protein